MTHNNILNTTADKLRRLGQRHEDELKPRLWAAKEQRDLFSYRFPATGLSIFGDDLVTVTESVQIAPLLIELAQLNLAVIEGRILCHKPGVRFNLLDHKDMWHTMRYEMKTETYIDDDDYDRVRYFLRKFKYPVALAAIATDGLVDDFFGAWGPDDDDDDPVRFDADRNWDTLLDIR